MNMEYAAQLRMIRESAAHFAASQGGPAVARAVHEGASACDMATWKGIADLGWFGIAVEEARGGLGLSAPAAAVVAEEAGRALMMPPVTLGMAAATVLAHGQDAAAPVLQDALAGDALVALAPVAGVGDGDRVASLVPDAAVATHWLLGTGAGSAFEARLLRKGEPRTHYETRLAVDGSGLADIRIDASAWRDAVVILDGEPGLRAWRQGRQLLWLLDAAYLGGLADGALALALEYMRLRRQFGAPIGSFQALQHRAATCHVDSKASRALVHEAARAWGGDRQAWAAAAAQHRAAACALRVTKEVIQFHGAIGFADEHDAGLYLKRAMTVGARYGREVQQELIAGME
jgi:alkylation response protein AidB-like acyl-CoA dehydrogenase